jgi:hypothetical protein
MNFRETKVSVEAAAVEEVPETRIKELTNR